ncbi:hypothetical protein I3271_05220 [Photobacterium leiognathi]|uniref:hypothetical protein n=1 Tax=Photobacterium leiognathi TaxID=553611 RepID=UPI001EDEA7F2|nr:hypothetical protein [Photobacterium leiognathi]MCG3884081.1 hypothetical protein [Photobacterium leiognathi]
MSLYIDECLKAGNSIIISRANVELVLPSVISELLRFTVAGIVDGAEIHVKRFDSQEPTHILSRLLAGGRYVLGTDDFERLYRSNGVLRC